MKLKKNSLFIDQFKEVLSCKIRSSTGNVELETLLLTHSSCLYSIIPNSSFLIPHFSPSLFHFLPSAFTPLPPSTSLPLCPHQSGTYRINSGSIVETNWRSR